jgi:polysaccharide export outer membrane protein
MIRVSKVLILFLFFSTFFSSCLINKDFILQTDEDFVFDVPVIDSTNREYLIPFNSIITITALTRNGDVIFESGSIGVEGATSFRNVTTNRGAVEFYMDAKGFIDLPMIGPQRLVGMTIFEAQAYLEGQFSKYFVDPYCLVQVTNRRYLFFSGSGGQGAVLPMGLEKYSLLEAITRGGGFSSRANSSKVKVIRNIDGKQKVYLFDLSTIESLKYFDFYIESGDIIYIEPMPQFASETLGVISPILSLISTVILYLSVVAK